jgi:hypothetical protein
MTISIVTPWRLGVVATVDPEVHPRPRATPRDSGALFAEFEKACDAQIERICAANRPPVAEEVADF